jgi:2-polyprenyl-3-methyl-5-hydroxy-6-metoxy-1,4-benzoquinol methylase
MATDLELDYAFRFLLGRPPTQEEVVQWAATPADQLREQLMSTTAFQVALPGNAVFMPLELPAPQVEWSADEPTVARMLARVTAQWMRLGQERPFWSSEMRPEFDPGQIDAHREQFAQTGETEVAGLLKLLERYGLRPGQFERVCDFGCGVGRVARPLARIFRSVTGCDVSTPHMMIARSLTGAAVTYALVDMPDFGMAKPFDLWFSTQTLQFTPPPVSTLILRRMFAMLAPGGLAVFQVPTEQRSYRFSVAEYLNEPDHPETLTVHCLPQAVVFALAAEAGCRPLEVREDGKIWPPTAVLSNRFVFVKPRSAPAAGPRLARR